MFTPLRFLLCWRFKVWWMQALMDAAEWTAGRVAGKLSYERYELPVCNADVAPVKRSKSIRIRSDERPWASTTSE